MERHEILALREGDSKKLHDGLFYIACMLERGFASGMQPDIHLAQQTKAADGLAEGAQFVAHHVTQPDGLSHITFELIDASERQFSFVDMPSYVRRKAVDDFGHAVVRSALQSGVVQNTLHALHVTDFGGVPRHFFGRRNIYRIDGRCISGESYDESQPVQHELADNNALTDKEAKQSAELLGTLSSSIEVEAQTHRDQQAERFAKVLQTLRL